MRNRKFLRSKRTPTAKSHCWADIDTERRKLGGRTWYLIRWFINFGAPLAAQVSLALHHLIFFLFFFFQNLLNFKTLSLFTTSYFILFYFFREKQESIKYYGGMSERQWIGDGQTLSVRLKSKVNLSIYASPSRALKVNGKSVDGLTKV